MNVILNITFTIKLTNCFLIYIIYEIQIDVLVPVQVRDLE